jgi:penicillin-binding protein 1B
MPVKLKLGPNAARPGFFSSVFRFIVAVILFAVLLGACVFFYYYHKYENVVDERLAAGPLFASVAQIYAAPQEIRVGQSRTIHDIAQDLRAAGYNSNPQLGTFDTRESAILVKPGPQSFHNTDGATITIEDDKVSAITADNGASLRGYELEPQLITALSEDKNRTKRRLVTYKEIPPELVQAVTAIEDRRFFEHGGINYARTAKCAFQDIVTHHKTCGGSTLTQQLAKNFFLTPDKTLKRKLSEYMITLQLENRFTKQQIFEMYANEMNLVHRGSYEINGVGEASQTLFGKDLSRLDLAQMATIAALFQNPSYRNPYRHPERALERRNLVLDSMVETGAITSDQAERAKAEGLGLAQSSVDAGEAPYFVDLVHDQIAQRISDQDLSHQSLRIYTSLDPQLQRAASEAVDAGMRSVDDQVRRLHGTRKGQPAGPIYYPQVALVALNPHTGQILALVGGRNYGVSQLNHAIAERPTGSIFKPFVYATAFNSSLNGTPLGDGGVFTALTRINDDPQDFGNGYTPENFEKGEYPGMVIAADALAHSLNIATIALAERVGLENVARLAHDAGIVNARPTPSMAIGTYNATPIDMAGAYTVFANGGVRLTPWMLASVRNTSGDIVADFAPVAKQVLDERTAYLTQSLLEGVINRGTAAGVRAHGFTAQAAGKTGTSHDAWFAGYTSNLICIIWIGNDDYTDVKLQGALAAAPLWADFMKRAIALPQYSDVHDFTKPDGVNNVRIDTASDLPADNTCPHDITLAFLDGTAPSGTCSSMNPTGQTIVDQMLNSDPNKPKKPNFFKRLFGGGDQDNPPKPTVPPPAR